MGELWDFYDYGVIFCLSLLEVLPDHLNAEIVAGTITSKQDAMDYITWTYFFRRLVMNPRYLFLKSVFDIEREIKKSRFNTGGGHNPCR